MPCATLASYLELLTRTLLATLLLLLLLQMRLRRRSVGFASSSVTATRGAANVSAQLPFSALDDLVGWQQLEIYIAFFSVRPPVCPSASLSARLVVHLSTIWTY
jgi:hypothetical protein